MLQVPHQVDPRDDHPGDSGPSELPYTVRTWNRLIMQGSVTAISEFTAYTAAEYGLDHHIDWFEHFPATRNHREANHLMREATDAEGLRVSDKPHPFRFGEDFGWFSSHAPTAMFGLGAGSETPALHHPDYDFPDDLIGTGVSLFSGSILKLLYR